MTAPMPQVRPVMSHARPLVAVDLGNSRAKFGWFDAAEQAGGDAEAEALPLPSRWIELAADDWQPGKVTTWLGVPPGEVCWKIASVNRPLAAKLVAWLSQDSPPANDAATRPWQQLAAADLPLMVELDQPERVGIDRLLAAVAANRLRQADRLAIVVDVGSAITVDRVSDQGAFQGGAILPGIAMSARALHEQTDLLPRIDMVELSTPPPALGRSTIEALQSGLFWGAIGAMRELIQRLSSDDAPVSEIRAEGDRRKGSPPAADGSVSGTAGRAVDVFVTGGAGPAVAELLAPRLKATRSAEDNAGGKSIGDGSRGANVAGSSVRYVEHLVLAGIALAAR